MKLKGTKKKKKRVLVCRDKSEVIIDSLVE